MKGIKYIAITLLVGSISFCSENKTENAKNKLENTCPCDSSISFVKDSIDCFRCYLGKSLIEFQSLPERPDTVRVLRYYTTDSVWHIQEHITVSDNKVVYPQSAFYCDFKEGEEGYEIFVVKNERAELQGKEIQVKNILGLEVVTEKDTFRSKDTSILIPKVKFKGIFKVTKKTGILYKGESALFTSDFFIEAKNMIKYGNLLEQYKAINEYCNKNSGAKIKEITPKKGPLAERK